MLKNIGSNWALSAIQIVMFLVLVPFVARSLGKNLYGAWEIIIGWTMPLQLLAMGIPMATVRHITSAVSAGDHKEADRVLGASLSLSIVVGLIALALGSVVYLIVSDYIFENENWSLSPAELKDAQQALLAMLLFVGSSFTLRLPYAIYDAHHDFVVRNLIQGGGFLLRFGLTLAALTARPSTLVLASVLISVAVCEFLTASVVSSRRHNPMKVRPGPMEKKLVKKLFSFGIFAFLINMGALLAFKIDANVIGLFMTPIDVADYALGNKIFDQFITLLLAIGMVAMPMATKLWSEKDFNGVRVVFMKWSKIATSMVMLVGGYLVVLGPEFLEAWLSTDYTPRIGTVMQTLMISFFFFLPMRGVALPVLMGIGKTKGPGFGLLAMGLCNLTLSLILVQHYGIYGVAVGTAVPNVVFALLFMYLACKHVEVPIDDYLKYSVQRSIFGALPALGFLALMKYQVGVEGWLLVLASGVVYTAIFIVCQLFFVYKDDPYTDPLALIKQKLEARRS